MSQDLFVACYQGSLNRVKTLLNDKNNPINIDYVNEYDFTALSWAAHHGHLDIVQYLLTSEQLTQRATVYLPSIQSHPLLEASRKGHFRIVQYLLSSKDFKQSVNIHHQDSLGNNALHYACLYGSLDIVQYLLASDEITEHASLYIENHQGHNALILACEYECYNIAHYLLFEHRFRVNEKTTTWLHEHHKQEALSMIQTRDLYHKMNAYLSQNPHLSHMRKV